MREEWLNGWTRLGVKTLVGSGLRCSGCGKPLGIICATIPEDGILPDKNPDWPFEENTCPVCCDRPKYPSTSEEMAKLDWAIIREAVKIKKAGI